MSARESLFETLGACAEEEHEARAEDHAARLREEERAVRRREAALAKGRKARARAAARRRSEQAREVATVRAWSARESLAWALYQRSPTPERKAAWLRLWRECPTTREDRDHVRHARD